VSGTKRIKRKRGRPPLPPDHLFTVFQMVENERYRTGLSAKRVCELIGKQIAKHGPLQITNRRTGEMSEIKSGRTLRSRYEEVLTAATPGSWPESHLNEAVRTGDVWLLARRVQIVDQRTGQPTEALRFLGHWGPTKRLVQARRRKLHNK
jgi:hypothetical protein